MLFVICPIPLVYIIYYLGFFKTKESAISYIIIIDLVFIISAPFIIFLINYIQSVVVYSKGIVSFDPSNNREIFMAWDTMESIENDVKFSKIYFVINSPIKNESLWIPFFVKDCIDFVIEINNYAGKNHILYKKLINSNLK